MLTISRAIIFLLFILLLGGCARLEKLSFSRMIQSFSPALQEAHKERIELKVEQLVAEGKVSEALELLQDESNNGYPPSSYPQTYSTTLNLLLKQAERDHDKGQYLSAGNKYRRALNGYPGEETLKLEIDKSREVVAGLVDHCADSLLDRGLIHYRNGQLEDAISVWSKIRQFHPSYKASRQAIETTQTQLKNLESFENKKPANGS